MILEKLQRALKAYDNDKQLIDENYKNIKDVYDIFDDLTRYGPNVHNVHNALVVDNRPLCLILVGCCEY